MDSKYTLLASRREWEAAFRVGVTAQYGSMDIRSAEAEDWTFPSAPLNLALTGKPPVRLVKGLAPVGNRSFTLLESTARF